MQIEMTQFTVTDYQNFFALTKEQQEDLSKTKPARHKGFVLFQQLMRDKGDTVAGGIDNVQRVRVLREKDDETKVSLDIQYKTPPRVMAEKKRDQERKDDANRRRAFPLIIPDVKSELLLGLRESIVFAKKASGPDIVIAAYESLIERIEKSDMNADEIRGCRNFLLQTETQAEFLNPMSDFLQALMLTYIVAKPVTDQITKNASENRRPQRDHKKGHKPRSQNKPSQPRA